MKSDEGRPVEGSRASWLGAGREARSKLLFLLCETRRQRTELWGRPTLCLSVPTQNLRWRLRAQELDRAQGSRFVHVAEKDAGGGGERKEEGA
mmetsp:Transcript_26308/g.63405  ORF Transcript_26308/g.63405 Transcript_26308/m.63405 type:complete len:93 (+) Transcript_26308:1874-2152(+)